LAPLSKIFASPGVPIWLEPASYACYSSTTTLTSKIIKQTIDNLFQFDLDKSQNYLWKDTFPRCPSFERSGIQCHCSPTSLLGRYQQSLSRYTTWQDVCVQESHAKKRL